MGYLLWVPSCLCTWQDANDDISDNKKWISFKFFTTQEGVVATFFTGMTPLSWLVQWMHCSTWILRPLLLATFISAWICNHIPSIVWGEITYPFPNFNICTAVVWECISNFIRHLIMTAITPPCWIKVNPCSLSIARLNPYAISAWDYKNYISLDQINTNTFLKYIYEFQDNRRTGTSVGLSLHGFPFYSIDYTMAYECNRKKNTDALGPI